MIQKEDLTGIIIAGGQSSRMGVPKGLLNYQGKPFIWHISEALKPLVRNIIVVSSLKEYRDLGYTIHADLVPNAGPAGGIYTGLHYSRTPWNICLSVDVPKIKTDILRALIEQASKDKCIVQCKTEKETHPLVAIYPKEVKSFFKAELNKHHFKLQGIVNDLNHSNLYLNTTQAKGLYNVNTKQDLNKLS